ncbi:hypothetical protein [Vibrio mediterranei]|uniref:hypothetical protein n=1 Tax=Vibrio mediterranei TaxID=689 RepID=UPI004069314D
MLDSTNEYFLRGVAVAFVIKAIAVWYLASMQEEYFVFILTLSLALLVLHCTTAVFFHYLAMKLGGTGFDPESKWYPVFAGIFSVHSATFFEDTEFVQSLNGLVQMLVALVFIAFMAFFSTYNAQKHRKKSLN